MKITVNKPVELDIAAIRVNVAVRYDEDDIPNDAPFRRPWREGDEKTGRKPEYDRWDVTIDAKTGVIRDWPAGQALSVMSMKVCDEGSYYLLDSAGNVVASIIGDYVPHCIPQEFGDYLRFDIDKSGKVDGWAMSAENVRESFFRDDD